MIELKNVCYAYGNEIALRYINLNIQKGESVIIQGPNGCGKSTLIKILNGIIFPMEGSYTYENHEITEKALKDSRFAKWFHQQIGYVFQNADTQLFCGSVEEEIAFGPTQMGLSEGEIKQRTDDCLKLFGIEKLRERPPYNLSGGEKRKVSLACILSMNPEVLILDEPLAGLDESTQKMLIDFLKKFHAAGKTLIIITHNNQLAKKLGTRFIQMNEDHEFRGTIENCSVSGSVSGTVYVGGVVGAQWGGSITGCSSSATVKGTVDVGGVAGQTNSSATLTACYATGNVIISYQELRAGRQCCGQDARRCLVFP